MSLRLMDEYDPNDWDLYHGKGPMRTVTHVEEPGGDRHFRERMDRWPGDECEEDMDESRE